MDIDQHPTTPSAPRRRRGLVIGIVAAAIGTSALSNGFSYALNRAPSLEEAQRIGGIAVPYAAAALVPDLFEAQLDLFEAGLDRFEAGLDAATDSLP